MNLTYKKPFRINIQNLSLNLLEKCALNKLKFGFYGLKTMSTSFIVFNQLELVRIKISRSLKKFGHFFFKIYIRVFLTISRTRKPQLTRMGKGSGPIKG